MKKSAIIALLVLLGGCGTTSISQPGPRDGSEVTRAGENRWLVAHNNRFSKGLAKDKAVALKSAARAVQSAGYEFFTLESVKEEFKSYDELDRLVFRVDGRAIISFEVVGYMQKPFGVNAYSVTYLLGVE